MDDLHDTKKYSIVGWVVSIFLHVTLGVVFWFITVDMTPIAPEYVEVTISQEAAADIPNISPETSEPPRTPSIQGSTQEQNANVVDIPKRTMSDIEKDKIPVDVKNELLTKESAQRLATRIDPLKGIIKEPQITKESPLPGNLRQLGTRTIEVDEKMTTNPSTEGVLGEINVDKPYDISWEGGSREVLNEKLPAFPENVQKEVILRFKIEVLPNGRVKEIIPLSKGEATLELITKQVLKQWFFNPLEESAPQESQFGIIVFRFTLK